MEDRIKARIATLQTELDSLRALAARIPIYEAAIGELMALLQPEPPRAPQEAVSEAVTA